MHRRTQLSIVVLATLALVFGQAALAYTIFLKDGSTIEAQEAYRIEGDKAIITLLNGTESFIDASEIDVERTRQANTSDLGTARVLEGGQVVEVPTTQIKKQDRLADVIARGEARMQERPEMRRETRTSRTTGASGFMSTERTPYRNLDVAGEIQQRFRAQGINEVQIFQGTEADRILADVTTNSEASVFVSLEVAARALLSIQELYPNEVSAVELLMMTGSRELAGQFEITSERAQELVDGGDTSTFFVEHVIF